MRTIMGRVRRGLAVAGLVLLAATCSVWPAQAAPGDSCGIGDVTTFGADGSDATDDTAAIQAAMAGAGQNPLCFPAGTFYFDQTLTHVPGYVGAGRHSTTLRYTGSGVALSSPTPGSRTYHWQVRGLKLIDGGTGTIGLDMPCVSQANVFNVQVGDFTTGLKISCAIDGGSLYNVYNDLTVSGATTGIRITGLSSNEHRFYGCRTNVTTHAVVIGQADTAEGGGNRNIFHGCAFETGTDGVEIFNADSDRNQVMSSRFETLTGFAVKVHSGVRGTVLAWNDRVASTTGDYETDGTDTTVLDNHPGGPALALTDTDTAGDPQTLLLNTARWSGTPLQVMRTSDDVELLRVNGDGALKPRLVTSCPLPSASRAGIGGLLVYDSASAPPKLILSTGSTWVYVDGGGSAC